MSHSNRPNVVVFFTDQQRFDTTGVHGNPLELTPNFDRVALEGTHFKHAFTPQPVCGPARACLQTGLYATTNGCFRNAIALPEACRTLAHYFGSAGYETAYLGKWHLGDPAEKGPVHAAGRGGYQHWLASNTLEFTSDSYRTVVYDEQGVAVTLPGYRVDALTDAGIRFIDAHQHGPFFLFMSFLEPHHQNHLDDYPPPEGYRERYTGRWVPPDLAALGGSTQQHLAGYYGMVKRLDEAFGRVLDVLKSLNLQDNTIVLFTSDHGCHFKTRNDEYKRSGHESSIRIPLALQGPGFRGRGQVQGLVSLVDVAPTLLEACGLDVPQVMQGRSLLPLVQHREVSWPEEVFVQISESEVGRAVRTKRWKYGVTAPEGDPWRDSSAESYREAYLYDLLADPYELHNLAGYDSHAEVAAVMRARLLRRMVEAGESLPSIVPASRIPAPQRHVTAEEARA